MTGTSSEGARPRRWMALVAAVLVAAVAVPGRSDGASAQDGPTDSAAAVGSTAGPPGVLPPDGHWTVTLVTGEVVDVSTDAEGRVTAMVREHRGPFRTVRHPDGELHVIPLAVTGLLDGTLDAELFNVTGLIRQGFDDESRAAIPLIVERGARRGRGGADGECRRGAAAEHRRGGGGGPQGRHHRERER